MTAEHYDVIIIGTGAGGGTLAHRLAPSGKRILLIERGGYLPREPENWDSREIFRKDRYLSDELWYDQDGEAFKPHQQYFVGGNTKFYGAILFRLRGTSAKFGTTGGSRRRGRSRIEISSRTTQRRKGSTWCTGKRAKTQPSHPALGRSRSRRYRTSRASSSSLTTSRRLGTGRSTCRSAST
jgi:choline dehydrogenase-like flavoprotein